MATNRPDVLDPALLRPGRLDRKIEIPLPNEQARMEILKIHAAGVTKHGDIDYEAIVKLADNFNGADLRNICTEAGMFAIRDERDYTVQVCITPQQTSLFNTLFIANAFTFHKHIPRGQSLLSCAEADIDRV